MTPVNPAAYDYSTDVDRLAEQAEKAGDQSTSYFHKNGNVSTAPLYRTDAPQSEEQSTEKAREESETAPPEKAETSLP